MRWIFLLILLLFLRIGNAYPQQTVGLFQTSPTIEDGYILFAPQVSTKSYLIDRCGREIHTWNSQFYPGLAAYLMPDGSLYRAGRIGSPVFNGGGSGGVIERIDWDGNQVWQYTYSNSDHHQHHDFYPLPNGNVLILAWEYHTGAEAIALGRDPAITGPNFWSEQVVEVRPILPDSGEIVWEWHLWDHIVQDRSISYPNYGQPANFPGRFDINYRNLTSGQAPASPDWIHANSVAYNPGRDEIVVNSRNMCEFWVIDHGTTTQQAASSTGGAKGKGGDILYRWGNPAAYGRGVMGDQQLYSGHSVHWIGDTLPGAGQFLLYNNGVNRPGGSYSTVEALIPPINITNHYDLFPGQPYGPILPNWQYTANPPSSLYSATVSGAERLPDGHTLICQGAQGRILEVDSAGQTYWEYISPIGTTGPTTQGNPPTGNAIFRASWYAETYPAFQGRTLTPGDPLEIDPLPLPANCLANRIQDPTDGRITLYPNPFSQHLTLQSEESGTGILFDGMGKYIQHLAWEQGTNHLNLAELPSGIYFFQVEGQSIRIILAKQ